MPSLRPFRWLAAGALLLGLVACAPASAQQPDKLTIVESDLNGLRAVVRQMRTDLAMARADAAAAQQRDEVLQQSLAASNRQLERTQQMLFWTIAGGIGAAVVLLLISLRRAKVRTPAVTALTAFRHQLRETDTRLERLEKEIGRTTRDKTAEFARSPRET
jgi:hypothetical protein